ncbi:MAG TPA: DUF3106 domain-containing protein [Caldimonas sp.]|nr:DUF3106 domain-containing protein [Caldimonas sp.]
MRARSARTARIAAASVLLVGACLVVASRGMAQPSPSAPAGRPVAVPPHPAAVRATGGPVRPRPEEGVRWQKLNAAQRQALAPLAQQWSSIDAPRKQKWLVIAQRFNSLPPLEQARITDRMTAWAKLTPAERGEMRLRYQESRQVRGDRSARWQAYQQLSPEQRKEFEARAVLPAVAPTALQKRDTAGRQGSPGKINIVSNPALAQPPRPVAPTVVQASRGATTHLITRPVAPPAHQQTGMPKIEATPEFVNRSTLLPRRGPQAAGVMPPYIPIRPMAAPRVQPAATAAHPGKTPEPAPAR